MATRSSRWGSPPPHGAIWNRTFRAPSWHGNTKPSTTTCSAGKRAWWSDADSAIIETDWVKEHVMSKNLVRQAMQRLVLPLGDLTTGQSVMKHLRLFHEAQYWSPQRLKMWQEERGRETVRVAYEETGFYRSLYDGAGV